MTVMLSSGTIGALIYFKNLALYNKDKTFHLFQTTIFPAWCNTASGHNRAELKYEDLSKGDHSSRLGGREQIFTSTKLDITTLNLII